MNPIKTISSAWSFGETFGKLGAGAIVGALLVFFGMKGCKDVVIAPSRVTIGKTDTVVVHDSIPSVTPIAMGNGSFSYTIKLENGGMFSASSASPLPLENLIFDIPVSTRVDTMTVLKDTCIGLNYEPPISLQAEAQVGISPIFTRALSLGFEGSAHADRLSLRLIPEAIILFPSLPNESIKVHGFLWVKAGYRL